jgi:hypothetical protein
MLDSGARFRDGASRRVAQVRGRSRGWIPLAARRGRTVGRKKPLAFVICSCYKESSRVRRWLYPTAQKPRRASARAVSAGWPVRFNERSKLSVGNWSFFKAAFILETRSVPKNSNWQLALSN